MHRTPEKNILVFYHANCPDGFGAAWSAWKSLGDTAEYIPYQHGRTQLPDVTSKEVYTLDMTLPEPVFSDVLIKAKSLTSIDHHITNQDHIGRSTKFVFNVNHSGASLSWIYFHPELPVPKLIQYVEDNDLWLHKLPFAQEIPSATWLLDYNFDEWSDYADLLDDSVGFEKSTEQGTLLLKAFLKQAGELAEEHYFIELEGMKIPVANCPGHVSDVGHMLYTKYPPMALMWSRKKNAIVVSLRSDGNKDVSELAVKYGGGGHKAAAGFTILLDTVDMPENKLKKDLLAKLLSPSQK
ncbi:MAG: DHHA1 domain-containing protein [Candidatus Paceibacterota bacterium]|jgi:oligoribonuclease NrnB/cAMP/cGMP phosphodiesterase (DHH superfamily)